MKDKVFFKIIIPNYNNIPYIKKCLDSILEQTFQDFKIIVIDDMSTDLSDKFCEAYARKYPDKIIFQKLKNKGYAGAARNAGLNIKNIIAEYIYFIDSDDFLFDLNSLQHLYDTAIKNNKPDLIRCQYEEIINNGIHIKKYLSYCPTIEQLPNLNSGPSCNCIKMSTLGNVRFQENLYRNNDVLWFLNVCDKVNSIAYTLNPIFVYNRINPISCQNSMTNLELKIDADYNAITVIENTNFNREEVIQQKNRYRKEILNRATKISNKLKNKISIEQILENSFVISFEPEKIKMMQNIFNKSGLKLPKVFPASHNSDLSGQYNCILSHVQIIRAAKAFNLPFVVIFEDDAYPCKQIVLKLIEVFSDIPDDTTILLLGWSNEAKPYGRQKFNEKYNKITQIISGSHAYVIFNNGYDTYLNKYQQNSKQTADGIFSTIEGSYILDKPLFIQYSKTLSMNKHIGYIFYGDNKNPPTNFETIENLLNNDNY